MILKKKVIIVLPIKRYFEFISSSDIKDEICIQMCVEILK